MFDINHNMHTVLIEYRNTLIKGLEISLAQELMSKRNRTKIPIIRELLKPKIQNNQMLGKSSGDTPDFFFCVCVCMWLYTYIWKVNIVINRIIPFCNTSRLLLFPKEHSYFKNKSSWQLNFVFPSQFNDEIERIHRSWSFSSTLQFSSSTIWYFNANSMNNLIKK